MTPVTHLPTPWLRNVQAWTGDTNQLVETSFNVLRMSQVIQRLPTNKVVLMLDVCNRAAEDVVQASFFSGRALRPRVDFPRLLYQACKGQALVVAPLQLASPMFHAMPGSGAGMATRQVTCRGVVAGD